MSNEGLGVPGEGANDSLPAFLSLGGIACPLCDWEYLGDTIVEQFHAYHDHWTTACPEKNL